MWRSILAARDLIKEGSKWQVGDGRYINVSTHKWLTLKPIFLGEVQPNRLVKDLIHDATGQWDRDKVFDLFAHKTRMEILQLPLSRLSSRDKLVWKENRSQSFSVETAYQVALRMGQQQRVEHSGLMAERKIWRKLWSLNVPPKVRMFVWRARSNVLLTQDNLYCRKINIDPRCEFSAHLLCECPFAQNVWALCRGKLQKCSNDAQDIFMLFRWLIDKLSKQELERWTVTAWAIWNARNKYYFEHIQIQPKTILDGALGFLQEYQHLVAAQSSN